MSEPENIQCFYAAMRAVLLKLHDEFPMACVLDSAKLMEALPENCPRRQGPFRSSDNYVAASIRFLRDEGLLRCAPSGSTQVVFPDCVLTSRGLVALKRPLSLGGKERTIVEQLRESLTVSDLVTVAVEFLQSLAS
jgi:hypothetical protein